MKYSLITVTNIKEDCTEFEAVKFLTDRQIKILSKFKNSKKQTIKFKINFNMNLVYKYIVVEK